MPEPRPVDEIEISPSQTELWLRCQRRWGFSHLENKREPSNRAAQAGTKVHDLLEKYLRDGTPIDPTLEWEGFAIGAIAQDMTQHLPPAGSVPQVETKLKLTVGEHKYAGRVDAIHEGTVYDHKTSSDLKRAKTEKQLETDVQALIYGRWMNTDGYLQWTTGQTKGEVKSTKTRLKVLKDEVEKRFEEVVIPLAEQIYAAYARNDPSSLEYNLKSCFLFPPQGCPHRIPCAIERQKKASMENKKMNLLDSLRASVGPANDPEPVDPINSPEGVALKLSGAPPAPVVEELPKKARKKREPLTLAERQAIPASQSEEEISSRVEAKPPSCASAENDAAPASESLSPTSEDDKQPAPIPDTDKPIRNLFVGCLPLGKPVKFAHEFIAKASQTVENDLELHHVLLAPYSTGGASLAAQIRADILSLGETDFDVVLMNRSPEGRAVEQVLVSLSRNIVVSL